MMSAPIHLLSFVRSIFSFLIISSSIITAQYGNVPEQKVRGNIFERNILPLDDSLICYISFRIPYNRLIFVKNNGSFSSGLRIDFELKENNRLLERKSISKKVSVNSYEESNSGDRYLEGFVDFRISRNNNIIFPTLQVDNTSQSIRLDSILINTSRIIQNRFHFPVVVEKSSNNCNGLALYRLVNHSNSIPFSSSDYSLIIPVAADSMSEVTVKLEQFGTSIFEQKMEVKSGPFEIIDCDGTPVITELKDKIQSSYLLLNNVNIGLKEGPFQIIINQETEVARFNMNVAWINKPITLTNPNVAVELLEIIYDRKELLDLFKKNNEEKYKSLVDFWDRKVPGRKYPFNELMNEFYKRADYASINFSTLANPIGAKTDRGRIYIRYGMPEETKREYSASKSVVEIWTYKDLQKEFVFTDKTGLGNYTLSN